MLLYILSHLKAYCIPSWCLLLVIPIHLFIKQMIIDNFYLSTIAVEPWEKAVSKKRILHSGRGDEH